MGAARRCRALLDQIKGGADLLENEGTLLSMFRRLQCQRSEYDGDCQGLCEELDSLVSSVGQQEPWCTATMRGGHMSFFGADRHTETEYLKYLQHVDLLS